MATLIDNDAKKLAQAGREEGFGHPGLVRKEADGEIYSGHINVYGELEIEYSADGSSWTSDTTFSEATNIDQYSFAVSDQDDIYVAYSIETSTNVYTIKVKKKHYSTDIWTEINSVTSIDSEGVVVKPVLIVNKGSASTRLHLFWGDRLSGVGHLDIYSQWTDDYGTGWTNGTSYPFATFSVGDYDHSLDSGLATSDGNVYLFYHLPSLGWGIYRVTFSSAGSGSGDARVSSGSNHSFAGVACAADLADVKYTLGYRNNGSFENVYLFRETTNYTCFTGIIVDGMLSVGIDGDDNVWCFYVKDSDKKAYYRKFDGTLTFGTETALTTGNGYRVNSEQNSALTSTTMHTSYYID